MMQEKNKNGIMALLVIIIIVLLVLIILLVSGKINYKNNQNDKVLTNDEALVIVDNIMDKFYTEVFYGHKETYCGEYDHSDAISTEAYSYYKSATYNTLSNLRSHLNTYISSSLVDYMLGGNDAPKYQEKDGKLYCLVWGRGHLTYNKNNSTYSISNITDTTISATASVSALSEGDAPTIIKATLGFDKIDGKWVLSTYEEN